MSKVALYLGKATPKVVNGLKSMSDDIDFSVYTSVSTFTQEAETRHLSFNRIVFNNRFIPNGEEDMITLNSFIREFSNSTELVMVINNGDTEGEELFNKYFSSPLHTCVIVKGATSMDFFRDIVASPISDIKARYYVLDKGTNQSKKEPEESSESGKVKKSAENVNTNVGTANTPETPSKPESFVRNVADDSTQRNISESTSKGGRDSAIGSVAENNTSEKSGSGDVAPVPVGSCSSSAENFSEVDEDALLSVGEYGAAHSDTDMFDEEVGEVIDEPQSGSVDKEAEERKREIEEQNRIAEEVQRKKREEKEAMSRASEGIEEKKEVPIQKPKTEEGLCEAGYSRTRINYVVSVQGTAVSQRLIDDSVKLTYAGLRVLLIDLDFTYYRLLSFIDTKKYYKGNHNVYTGGSMYTEDGVSLLTGGYGYKPSAKDVAYAIDSYASSYDVVIVNLPVESLKLVSVELLMQGNIIVMSCNDPCDIVATSLALSNRGICSCEMERLICEKCKCVLIGGKNSLVEETVSRMMMPNGCWVK